MGRGGIPLVCKENGRFLDTSIGTAEDRSGWRAELGSLPASGRSASDPTQSLTRGHEDPESGRISSVYYGGDAPISVIQPPLTASPKRTLQLLSLWVLDAPVPDLLPQLLECRLFARKRPLHGMVGLEGYKTSGWERRARCPGQGR